MTATARIDGTVRAAGTTDNGYRFEALVSPLPVRMQGGDPDTHVLVSFLAPFERCHLFTKTGVLHWSYVCEKLRLSGPNDAQLRGTLEVLQLLLPERTVVLPDVGPMVTKTGRVLTDADVQALADEADR